ncbi:MAG TPA: glutaredoxin family protein [Burkholderiaceae bacterium]|nr:glutaredoxin family protein [Burkholderiaceae bacterium]
MKAGGCAVLALLILLAAPAAAQYRWRDSSGQMNYGDFPPSDARDLQRVDSRTTVSVIDPSNALPFELRRATAQYPAVLYTSADCVACDNARVFLRQRGVPFGERVVEAPEDIEVLRRLTGGDKVPALTLGRDRLLGFSGADWTRALDAAGYPAESKLPPGYRSEAPEPLVARPSGPANRIGPAQAR